MFKNQFKVCLLLYENAFSNTIMIIFILAVQITPRQVYEKFMLGSFCAL